MASDAALDLIVNLKDNASKSLNAIAKSGGFLKDALSFATGGLIEKGVEAVTGTITGFFSDGISEAQGWNAAMAQTEAVIKSTGGAAGLSAQQMGDLAASLSGGAGVSLASDDAVLAGENLLATFTNIGKDTFPRATATMVDMAQAMGTDVKGGAIQLGKALNDPIAGIGALSRVGVTFTDTQKDMIKTMVEAGNVTGAQTVILNELDKEFGGSAAAAAKADGGMFTLSESLANVKQTIGDALLPILHELAGFIASPAVMGALQGMADLVAKGLTAAFDGLKTVLGVVVPPIQAFAAVLAQAFGGELKLDTLQALPGWLQPLGALFGTIAENVGEFFRAIQSGTDPLAAIGELIKNNFTDMLPKIGGLLGGIAGAVGDALPGIVAKIGELAGAFLAWIGPLIPPALAQLAEWAGALGGWLVSTGLPMLGQVLLDGAAALWHWIEDATPKVLTAIGHLWDALGAWLGSPGFAALVQQLARWQAAAWQWIVDATPQVLAAIGRLGQALWDWLGSPGFRQFVVTMQKWTGQAAQWIADSVPPMLGQLAAWAGQLVGWLLTEGLPKLIGTLAGWTVKLVAWIIDSIPGLLQNLGIWAGQLWTWITSIFTPTGTANMSAAGGDIIQGLIDGIGAAAGAVIDAIGTIWTNLSQSFTSAAGINSPSTVFYGFGSNIVQGLVNALAAGKSAVVQQMLQLAQSALTTFQNALGIHSPSDATASMGDYLVQGLNEGLVGAAPTLQTGVSTLATGLITSLQTTLAPAKDTFGAMLTDMAAALDPHLNPSNAEGLLGKWATTPDSLLSIMYGRLDGSKAALRPNVRLSMSGMLSDMGDAIDGALPGIVSSWGDGLHNMLAATQEAVAGVKEAIQSLNGMSVTLSVSTDGGGGGGGGGGGTPPGGNTAPLPPGAPGTPAGSGGGGGGGQLHTNATAFGGGGGNITVWVLVPGIPGPLAGQATTSASEALRWQQELGRL